jgi:DNA-binding transcriptional regulator YiaG
VLLRVGILAAGAIFVDRISRLQTSRVSDLRWRRPADEVGATIGIGNPRRWSRADGKKQGTNCSLKKTTEVMHNWLGRAVNELRQRLECSQEELARAIGKHGGKTTDHMTVSRWERGIEAPSPIKRMALGKIAAKHGHEELADVFRAPTSAWRLVARLNCCQKRQEQVQNPS